MRGQWIWFCSGKVTHVRKEQINIEARESLCAHSAGVGSKGHPEPTWSSKSMKACENWILLLCLFSVSQIVEVRVARAEEEETHRACFIADVLAGDFEYLRLCAIFVYMTHTKINNTAIIIFRSIEHFPSIPVAHLYVAGEKRRASIRDDVFYWQKTGKISKFLCSVFSPLPEHNSFIWISFD